MAARRISGIFMIKNSSPVLLPLSGLRQARPFNDFREEERFRVSSRGPDVVARRCNIIAAFNYFDYFSLPPFVIVSHHRFFYFHRK